MDKSENMMEFTVNMEEESDSNMDFPIQTEYVSPHADLNATVNLESASTFDERKYSNIDFTKLEPDVFERTMRSVSAIFEEQCKHYRAWLTSDPRRRIWPSTNKNEKNKFRQKVKRFSLENGVLYYEFRKRHLKEGWYIFWVAC